MKNIKKENSVQEVHELLFQWWRKSGRVLPWREKSVAVGTARLPSSSVESNFQLREHTFNHYFAEDTFRNPYRVVVAELMLQQTQVDRVFPKYQAWMEKWPFIKDLARAPLSEVLIFWQGLGYNRRARFLWLLAKEITEKLDGVWPTTEEELLKLPGIGKYTARAVMSFAFGEQVGVVDTNVKRILDRVFLAQNAEGDEKRSEFKYFVLADSLLPAGQADPWNQALMDFGALVCTAKAPKCLECPLHLVCLANLDAQQKGFVTYAAYLTEKTTQEKLQGLPKKVSVKFQDTNRYFRGRLMDELRVQSLSNENLSQIMSDKYGLADQERFKKIILDLENEGLIKKWGNQIALG